MRLNKLSLHPKQYYELKEPLRIFVGVSKSKPITTSEFEIICETLAKRKTPLVITGKLINNKEGRYWKYYLQMPTYSLQIGEGDGDNTNLTCSQFHTDDGNNKGYHNRFQQMFLLDAAKGIYLIYQHQAYYVCAEGGFRRCAADEHVEWKMSPDAYDDMIERMRSYFEEKDEYERSKKVSDKMKKNVMEPFEQYTQKEHEFETKKVDFTKGVLYCGKAAAGVSRGKKSCYELTSNDPSADPENCTLQVGQRVAIYREDQSFTNLVGLLVEIDSADDEGVRFVLEFYQQFDRDQLPERGYLFVHQNDTQLKIRKNVSSEIRKGKTRAEYIYKTFHDFSTKGYESLEKHTGLVDFLYKRMGKQFPPNQMQLEAIVKGILTEDLLLVLGPPGTGKTTVILSWVEYFLSQGKRVLISSQNNSAVDNVLERLGEDRDREIVRLGREEKVQENCKQFIPYYRIGTMRSVCESNSERLEGQLTRELAQIDAYIEALKQMKQLLIETAPVDAFLHSLTRDMKVTCGKISALYSDLKSRREELQKNVQDVARYNIFLEEFNKKGFLARLFQFGMRLRAKRKLGDLGMEEHRLKEQLQDAQVQYHTQCRKLEQQLQEIREKDALGQHRTLHGQIQALQAQILGGGDGTGGLFPAFESELKHAESLRDLEIPGKEDLEDLGFLEEQLVIMANIRVSGEKILNASRHWVNAALKGDRNEVFEEILLEACQVVGATCIGINSNKLFRNVDFDVTIIDESGQIQLQNALVPISRSPKTLMLGDYKQIPPIVNDEIVAACRNDDISTSLYEQSFFEFLFEEMRYKEIERLSEQFQREQDTPGTDPEVQARREILRPRAAEYVGKPIKNTTVGADGREQVTYSSRYSHEEVAEFVDQITRDRKKIVNLNSQFRMPGNISDVISEWFYESNYYSSYDMSRFKPVVPGTSLPMVIIDTSKMHGRFETQPENKMGYQNLAEAELVADVLETVLKAMDEKGQQAYLRSLDKYLGVISAYGAQVRYIRQVLSRRLGLSRNEASTAVASLDSFQGQERDLIIYSLTRSSRKNSEFARVGFLKELRRLNVAFTRCKKQLVIIGDMEYLLSCMYVDKELDREELPCAGTKDDWIDQTHIDQCAKCEADCERRFSRFFRLLMQHAQADPPAGNLIPAERFKASVKGGESHAERT